MISLTQRVTGPGENVSPVSLFIFLSIFESNEPEKGSDRWQGAVSAFFSFSLQLVVAASPVSTIGLKLPVCLTAGQREEREA